MSEQQILEMLQAIAQHKQKVENLEERLHDIVTGHKDDMKNVSTTVKEIKETFAKELVEVNAKFSKYVTTERFKPVETLSYGLVAGILLAVLGALMTLVIKG